MIVPLTPFHLGPGLFIGVALRKRVDIVAVLLSSVIIDIRTAVCYFTGCEPLHGPLHTLIGATVFALILTIVLLKLGRFIEHITAIFHIERQGSWTAVVSGSLIGAWVHILLDSFLYSDIRPFYPSSWNPLLDMVGREIVYIASIFLLLAGAVLYLITLIPYLQNKGEPSEK